MHRHAIFLFPFLITTQCSTDDAIQDIPFHSPDALNGPAGVVREAHGTEGTVGVVGVVGRVDAGAGVAEHIGVELWLEKRVSIPYWPHYVKDIGRKECSPRQHPHPNPASSPAPQKASASSTG